MITNFQQLPTMIYIPAGPFEMGIGDAQIDRLAAQNPVAQQWREAGRFSREQPAHTVILPAYTIGQNPVLVSEFRAFVAAGGYQHMAYWTDAGWAWRDRAAITQPRYWDDSTWTGADRLPVVGVSWYEAVAYCRWLSAIAGQSFRLPTEAEWEKAARGGDGRLFPWGDKADMARCTMRDSGPGHTVPVGRTSPAGDSPYGCVDMVGNVSEWTLSRFEPYPIVPGTDRDDPAGEALRVTRGGSWHSPLMRARTTSRGMNDPDFCDTDLGFRCAGEA